MKFFFLFLLLSTSLFAQVNFPVDTIAYNERFNNRMFAVYDTDGKLHLTYTGQLGTDGTTREIYYVKEESSGEFTTINLTQNSVDDNYSTLSIDAEGNLHIGYETRDGSDFQIRYMHNMSGSFSSPIVITQGGLNKATPYSKIGPDSVMHFVYYTFVTGTDNVFYRNYDLRTGTLSPEVSLATGEAGGDFEATLDVDSNGKVHIAARTGTGLFSGPIVYYNNISGSFQSSVIAGDGNYPMIALDNNDKVHIVYRSSSRLYYTNNVSGSFSTPVPISPVGQLPAGMQSLTADDENRLFITYQSSQSASGRGFYLLFAENGEFYDTILVNDISSEYVTRNSSQVITKGNGDIAIFYVPGGIRNGEVIADIFLERGNIYDVIPVELASFNAAVSGNDVTLNWITASETNNYGFEIQRSLKDGKWEMENGKFIRQSVNEDRWEVVGFVEGKGTTTEQQFYTFTDKNLSAGKYQYRLKQIDFDGSVNYSKIVEVNTSVPVEFVLEQNYPNPFNPSTKIKFTLPEASNVSLKVYDMLGREAATLIDEFKPAGNYDVEFSAESFQLSSGVYFYRLNAGDFTSVKKMILSK